MTIDVLEVLRLGAINVARQVHVKVILRITDLSKRYHPRVLWNFSLPIESVDDLVNVLLPQAVFVAVLEEAPARIDNKDTFAGGGVLLVEHNDASRDTGSVKQVWWKADDPLDVTPTDYLFANFPLDIA